MKSSRFSLPRSVIFTRRTATVTISAPLSSTAALVSAKSRYLPVPTISRDLNFLPPNSNKVSCIFSALRVALSAADEVDYLDLVAGPHNGRVVIGLRHNLAIDLDRHAPATHLELLEQRVQRRVAVERIRVAVECD